MGVRPDLTGQGQGIQYINTILDFAAETFHPPAYRVTIAKWNIRAQRVWEKAGFKQIQSFKRNRDDQDFVILTRDRF